MMDLIVLALKVTAIQLVLGYIVASLLHDLIYFLVMRKFGTVCEAVLKAMAELEGKKK